MTKSLPTPPALPTSATEPTWNFRGTFNQPHVISYLASGYITSTELVLLSIIDALSQLRGEGCWASKPFLAGILHVSPRQIQNLLGGLQRKGLIVKVGTKKLAKDDVRNVYVPHWVNPEWVRTGGEIDFSPGGEIDFSHMSASQTVLKNSRVGPKAQTRENPTENEPMGFFGDTPSANTKARAPLDPEHLQLAQALRAGLAQTRGIRRRVVLSKWADEFRILEEERTPRSDIRQTLTWLLAHAKDKYTPDVQSAKSFRAKYHQLRAAMDRRKSDTPDTKDVQIGAKAMAIAQEYVDYPWPGGRKKFAAFVQLSIDGAKWMREKLRHLKDDGDEVALELREAIGDPYTFTEEWITQTRSFLSRVEFKGDLLKLAFGKTETSYRQLEALLRTSGYGSRDWTRLKEKLDANADA